MTSKTGVCLAAYLSLVYPAAAALAQTAALGAPKKILVVTNESEAAEMKALTEVMAAHFRDLNAETSLQVVPLTPRDLIAQVEIVRQLVRDQAAFSAVWVERSSEEIFLFVSDKFSQKVFVQTFEGGGDGWEMACETIAALVRSALISWLEVIPEARKKPAAPPLLPEPPAPRTEPKRLPPKVAVSAAKTIEKSEPRQQIASPLIGRFTLGFATRMIAPDEPWTYNALVDAKMLLFETFTIGAETQIGSALDLNIPDVDVVLRNYPIYLKAGYFHTFGRFEMEVGVALFLAITYLDNVPGWGKIDATVRGRFGPGIFLQGGMRVLPVLSIVARFGADFFFNTARYIWNDVLVLNYGPTQLILSFGLEFSTK